MRKKCLKFIQQLEVLQSLLLLLSIPSLAAAQVSRAPANFVPDDDQILVPMIIERNMMDDFHDKHKNDFKDAKQKIRHWLAQEEYADAYGFEANGVVDLPTPEEKQRFFQKNYLRYISKDVERGAQDSVKDWYEDWSADDELAAMEAQEQKEEFLIKARQSAGRQNNDLKQEVKVGKSKVDFLVQPRLEMGMVKIRLRSPYIKAQAWLGVNGNQEIELERKFESTQTRAKLFYFIEQQRVLASVDQRLADHLSLRLTHDRIDGDGANSLDGKTFENNVVQIRFGMGF